MTSLAAPGACDGGILGAVFNSSAALHIVRQEQTDTMCDQGTELVGGKTNAVDKDKSRGCDDINRWQHVMFEDKAAGY